MRYTIRHEFPGRLRLSLAVPHRRAIEAKAVEGLVASFPGVRRSSFHPATGSLLVLHDGRLTTRQAVLSALDSLTYPRLEPASPPGALARAAQEGGGRGEGAATPANSEGEVRGAALRRRRRGVLLSGALLAARPFLPLWIRPALALYGSLPVVVRGLASLRRRRLGADALDGAAVGVALATRDYGTAGTISFLLKLGGYLEEWTRHTSGERLSELFPGVEGWAWVRRNGDESRLDVAQLRPGDLVVVRAGGRIPVDGEVAEGEALVNQASMTGESLAVPKHPGVLVYAGTALEAGSLVVRAVNVGQETKAARIIHVIQESEGRKAEVHSQAERLADRLVPYSFLLTGLTYALTGNAARAAAALLVDYSCAIKLSAPLAIRTAMVDASKRGVLMKGGRSIEKLAAVDVFVLDKTGTLTQARPDVVAVVAVGGYSEEFVLTLAACVEEHFPHPMAAAIVNKAEREGLVHGEEAHAEPDYVLAHGIVSQVGGRRVLVGSRHFVEDDNGVPAQQVEAALRPLQDQGYSILYVAVGEELAGAIAVEDPLREDSLAFLRRLRREGMGRVMMLTGDGQAAARKAAADLGIPEYRSRALPEEKAEIVRSLKRQGHVIAMVGDGMNDSPALAVADVGISLRQGADIAREVADVMLLRDRLEDIVDAKRISERALAMVQANFRYILGINSALIGLALTGILPPPLSALAHNATTVAVAANSLRPYPDGGWGRKGPRGDGAVRRHGR